jgi:hypothetical protein
LALADLPAAGTQSRANAALKDLPMRLLWLLRLVGIAIGSTVAAWLIVSFLAAGMPPSWKPFVGLAVLILGALIYADVRRRDRPLA